MPPELHPYWAEELERTRRERDRASLQLVEVQATLRELVKLVADANDKTAELLAMLRRRETQLDRLERENRELREALGLDPDPDPADALDPSLPQVLSSDDLAADLGVTPGTVCSGTSRGCVEKPAVDPSARCETGSEAQALPVKKPRPRSRGGRRPPPTHLHADPERHAVGACEACGGRVLHRDVLVTPVYTMVKSYVRVRRIERERVLCADPACGHATTAPMPPMPCPRALYDCRFLAWLVVMKFVLLVPLDRIRVFLQARGIDLAMGTLVSLIARAATLLDPIDGVHLEQLRAGAYMCFDGTGLKTLILGQSKAWDGYIEVYARDELSVFQFDLTKHADRLQERIRDYAGVLVCDAESRNAAGAPGVTLAHCNAHPLRALKKARNVQPKLAAEGMRFIQRMYAVDEQVRDATVAERTAWRQRHTRPIAEAFRRWLDGVVERPLPPSDPVRRVAKYYIDHWEGLTRFIDRGDLPLDNNEAEREFQRHAKLRYASLFAGSPEGAHRWATILGVVRTAQKCGVDVEEYLVWAFERRGTHRAKFGMRAAELTPAAYREHLAAVAERLAS